MAVSSRGRNNIYTAWWNIVRRCTDPTNNRYPRYGGRGITMCEEWLNDFHVFENWCKKNGYEPTLTIDRIDNNKGYSPDNCRWVTVKEQANNRSTNRICTFNGFTGTLSEVCDHFGLSYGLVNGRIQKGWTEEQAFSHPNGAPTKKRNRLITFKGVTKTVSEWNRLIGGTKNTLSQRLRAGYSTERALTEPIKRRCN